MPWKKIEEKIGEFVASNTDATSALKVKSKHTLQLFVNKKSLRLELISNFILLILFSHKAHKYEKYPMLAIVSRIGAPPCGISQYRVELIQPTLNTSKYKINSSFVNEV